MNNIYLDLDDAGLEDILALAVKDSQLDANLKEALTDEMIDLVSNDFLQTGEFFAIIEINQDMLASAVSRAKKQIEIDSQQQLKMSQEG
jgi:DNA-binding protein YbaB